MKRKYYPPGSGHKRLPLRTGPITGAVLSFAFTLGMWEGQQLVSYYERTGRIPDHHLSKFLDFLAKKPA